MVGGVSTDASGEFSPLLEAHSSDITIANRDTSDDYNDGYALLNEELDFSRTDMIKQEMHWLVKSSIPVSLSYLVQLSFNSFSLLNVGRLGVTELAAASLGLMLANFLIYMPGYGLACALESFCGAAFTASADKTRVGMHAQRGLVAITLMLLPILFVLYYIDDILVHFGQSPEMAKLSSRFLRIWSIGCWPMLAFESLKRFLQSMNIMQVSTWVTFIVAPFHVIISYMLVWSSTIGVGFIGMPLGMTISNWMLFIGISGYIVFSKARHAWGEFSLECMNGISEYYRIAIPGALMMALSWAAMEITTLGAAMYGSVAVAAQACVFSSTCVTYQLSSAIGSAVAARIGHCLGEGKQRRACIASNVSLVLNYVIYICLALLLIYYRDTWGYIYSDDDKVIAMCARLAPCFAFAILFDGLNGQAAGVMRALGRQKLGSILAFPSYWIIGMPFGVFLAKNFAGLDSLGLFVGLTTGMAVFAMSQECFMLFFVDWKKEVKICLDRLARSTKAVQAASSESADPLHSSLEGYGTIV
ncbi:ethionine resistance protein [Coemansia sp. RSA 1722]|nr:ethionine resistance protein [Coemansia sp. RSA 486]KAJ2226558.1 ethionine resistance protein [Coemansia sp. RSA 485]KAJ2587239.1 ethionine resistance protein [Coemansia sp. RSA 1722]